jgi:membrane protease YdiL (CAAX protease family)
MTKPMSKDPRHRVAEALRHDNSARLLEIIVVMAPIMVGLLLAGRGSGNDFVPLGGSVVLLGAPVAWLGGILTMILAWVSLRLRGSGWHEFGLGRPRSWLRTILSALAALVIVVVVLVGFIEIVARLFPNAPPPDASRFDHLRGHLPNLIINVVAVWITAGFIEEMLWRGFLMNRVAELGGTTRRAWALALVVSALLFGLAHTYQGASGVVLTGVAGLLLGVVYLVVKRNLWVLVIAHGMIDMLDFVQTYFSGA